MNAPWGLMSEIPLCAREIVFAAGGVVSDIADREERDSCYYHEPWYEPSDPP